MSNKLHKNIPFKEKKKLVDGIKAEAEVEKAKAEQNNINAGGTPGVNMNNLSIFNEPQFNRAQRRMRPKTMNRGR